MCETCHVDPCVCDYIRSLMPGGRNAWLAEVAAAQARLPFPHREACPCVGCYRDRLMSWESHPNVVPLRTAR